MDAKTTCLGSVWNSGEQLIVIKFMHIIYRITHFYDFILLYVKDKNLNKKNAQMSIKKILTPDIILYISRVLRNSNKIHNNNSFYSSTRISSCNFFFIYLFRKKSVLISISLSFTFPFIRTRFSTDQNSNDRVFETWIMIFLLLLLALYLYLNTHINVRQ